MCEFQCFCEWCYWPTIYEIGDHRIYNLQHLYVAVWIFKGLGTHSKVTQSIRESSSWKNIMNNRKGLSFLFRLKVEMLFSKSFYCTYQTKLSSSSKISLDSLWLSHAYYLFPRVKLKGLGPARSHRRPAARASRRLRTEKAGLYGHCRLRNYVRPSFQSWILNLHKTNWL